MNDYANRVIESQRAAPSKKAIRKEQEILQVSARAEYDRAVE